MSEEQNKTLPGQESTVQHHEVKCWPEFFGALDNGIKSFDVRLNDRDYQPGDEISYREWDPRARAETGGTTKKRIVYVLALADVPAMPRMRAPFVVLGLEGI